MADGPVPSVELFRASVTKPSAFESIADSIVANVLEQQTDIAASAFGDRAILPILTWSSACDSAVIAMTARVLMGYRGYKRDGAGDAEYVGLALRAEEWLEMVAQKRRHPSFTDSRGSAARPDAPRITSSRRSDDWTRRPCR